MVATIRSYYSFWLHKLENLKATDLCSFQYLRRDELSVQGFKKKFYESKSLTC